MKLPQRRARHPGLPPSRFSRMELSAPPGIVRRVRAIRRGLTIALWTLPAILIQTVMLMLPGRAKMGFARFYWASLCSIMGLKIRVIGTAAQRLDGRPVVFASNHSSWLDVLALGGVLDACFIAKADVAGWPVISTIARLGRTVYVTRRATSTGRERDDMRGRLDAGDNLILFPEGTSSDGSRVLPFRSAFFSVVEAQAGTKRPLIQPVSIVYDQLAGLPMGRASRPVFAWYGDMDLASHFWRLAQHRGLRVSILLHAPIDPAAYPTRKALSAAVWQTVAEGAATLRQNRPAQAQPHAVPAPGFVVSAA